MDRTADNETRWIKLGGQDQMKNIFFVGKDVVAVSQSFNIHFLKYKNEEKGSPQFLTYDVFKEDDEVEGITCVAGHEGLPMFATAMTKAQIQLFSYPTFAQVTTLRNKSENTQALSFSDGEILVALSSAPDYALTIWNWLSGKKLRTVLTNITSLDQKLM
ncbi:hypothetical protein J437_LFUL012572 [Ladona fulva]|uniref:Cilia- and flagella-associated protein 43 n=1 Tax=Ladona fulva TaxID=123851 RepID=A0A8K0KIW5_LADFU|nr:hypothetical protein J437_LFUL012572 [Ladona fulva]